MWLLGIVRHRQHYYTLLSNMILSQSQRKLVSILAMLIILPLLLGGISYYYGNIYPSIKDQFVILGKNNNCNNQQRGFHL